MTEIAGNRGQGGDLPDRDQRDLIVSGLDKNMLVEAAAGTGKTTSLLDRMVALLGKGVCGDIGTLAAVTFTRKAAAELRAKFQVRLEKAVLEAEGDEKTNLASALDNIERCFIGTIHSFCARMLRERPVEANVDLSFSEVDEQEDNRLRAEAWEEYSSRVLAYDREGVLGELRGLGLRLMELKEAFMVFADYPDVDEWPTGGRVAMPDLGEARREMVEYAEHMELVSRRFPEDPETDGLMPRYRRLPGVVYHYDQEGFRDLDQFISVLRLFDRGPGLKVTKWTKDGAFTKAEAREEESRWNDFRERVAAPVLQAVYRRRYPIVLKAMFGARCIYDELRAASGVLNFQDLLMKTAALLREKPHVRSYFQHRFTHVLVDEFQDTDPIQAEVLLLLVSGDPTESDWRECRPRPGALFVVGDPKQSIYRFRRADIAIYNEVKRIICGPGGEGPGVLVELFTNFRSTGKVVDWVNEVFEPGEGPVEETSGPVLRFPPEASKESPGYVALEQGRIDESPGELSGLYSLGVPAECKNKELIRDYEPDRIARTIRHLVDSGATIPRTANEAAAGKTARAAYDDFMVITRLREPLGAYAEALQRYGIPHRVTGGSALNQVEELGLLHACLKAVIHPDDPVALVAALRSELFGISDASLYRFKKAGGAFSYFSEVPGSLSTNDRRAFRDTFERLSSYRRWLDVLPPVSAVEKIIDDSGLMARAAIRQGGDVDAGSLGKAVELLRSSQADAWSKAQMVEHVGELVRAEEKYDGISARSRVRPAVRVMNLHKVKGMEAPVVFLADLYGDSTGRPAGFHIDRSGDRVVGYMAVDKKLKSRYGSEPVARPAGWEAIQEKESAFLRAEELRLRYVAATRAASALVVTRPEKSKRSNPWRYFLDYIPEGGKIPDPGPQSAPTPGKVTITADEISESLKDVEARMGAMFEPTYRILGAKEYALAGEGVEAAVEIPGAGDAAAPDLSAVDGCYGVEWGTAIHSLLQVVADNPGADLERAAEAALDENGLDPSLSGVAVETVKNVTRSEIWERAAESESRLAETPFCVLVEDPGSLPTLIRGSIDLVFKEGDGWVLVDYKTDSLKGTTTEELAGVYTPQLSVYARAWEMCTGEPVKEAGLYFTSAEGYVEVSRV